MSLPTRSHVSVTDDDLFETIVEDFTAQCRGGARPDVEAYVLRYPQLADLLRELLPTIAAVERVKSAESSSSGKGVGLRPPPPQRLGDFRIVREIGYGGMGIVYEAVQESLARSVALKILPAQLALDPSRVARFEQEARIAASLHHTNIVPVFGVGHDEGMHYYVMQLIDGAGLDRLLAEADGRRFPPRRAVAVVRDAARALHEAHLAGTLHRDVKPGNILLDRRGHVWITDFGLALVLEAVGGTTMHVGGTLRYMPPERFQGVSEARGDIYGLGVTLYEMLGGRPAFDAATNVELMRQINVADPKPLRQLVPAVPRDLETIVAKAMARDSAARYPSAEALADDLSRYLEGLPIQARRVGVVERARRWCGRNRLTAAALVVACGALVSLSFVSLWGYWKEARFNRELTASLDRERLVRERAEAVSATALEALDRVFLRMAPTNSLAAAFATADGFATSDGAQPSFAGEGTLIVPAVSPQIAAALEDLLPYYLKLAEQRAFDPRVRRQAASAMHRIGLIHGRLGRFDEARAVWNRAAALYDELRKSRPADAPATDDAALAAASLAGDLGDLERLRDDRSAAEAAYARGLDLLDSVAAEQATFESRREEARLHLALGTSPRRPPPSTSPRSPHPPQGPPPAGPLFDPLGLGFGPEGGRPPHPPRGRGSDGGPHPDGGLPPREAGPPSPPGLERRPYFEAEGAMGPAPHRDAPGRPPGFEPRGAAQQAVSTHLDRAYELLRTLVDERPADAQARLLLARCRRERSRGGDLARSSDRRSEDFVSAVALLRSLCDEYPAVPDFAYELSETLTGFHVDELSPDDFATARTRLDEAVAISERLVREHPETPAYAASLVHVYNRLAALTRHSGATRESVEAHRKAFELQTQVAERNPTIPMHHVWRARIAEEYASLLIEEGRRAEAEKIIDDTVSKLVPLSVPEGAVPGAVPALRDLQRLRRSPQSGP